MREKLENDRVTYALAALFGIVAFAAIYGTRVLNPVYDDWLLGRGDLTQHYLGWCFYRRGAWTFPIGLTDNLAYPSYTSVIFTDSIPLLAVFFKLLSPVLPDKFQYFGLWGIAGFALQGYFAAKILRECSAGRLQALIGSIFFIVSPIVIERMFKHTALAGHWIILVAVYFYVRHGRDYNDIKKTVLCWGAMGGLVALVHLYYLPMCGAFLCGFVLCSFCREKRIRLKYLLPGCSFGAALFICTYLMGGFSTRAASTADGLGECSFNLNGFFNEKGYSRFFDMLPMYNESQYEGFAYLGLGIFILMAVAVVFLAVDIVKNRGQCIRKNMCCIAVGLLISAGLTVFAASPMVTWNDRLLFVLTDSSTLTHYWSIFRATGRIIWPVYYLIYISVIVCCGRMWGKYANVGAVFLAVCCFLQIFDISGRLMDQRRGFAGEIVYTSSLEDGTWQELSQRDGLKHLVWVSNSYENRQILEISKWAYDNGLTMNIFYFARGLSVTEDTRKSLQEPDDTYLFVFKKEELPDYAECGLNFYEAGQYVIGTTFELEREMYDTDGL